MVKSNILKANPLTDIELNFWGISSPYGVPYLATQINRFLDIELSMLTILHAEKQNEIVDNFIIFSNFKHEEKTQSSQIDIDQEINLDLTITQEHHQTKYVLLQTKGEKTQLYPKLAQLDLMLISDYPIVDKSSIINQIPEINLFFPILPIHISSGRMKYYKELFCQ